MDFVSFEAAPLHTRGTNHRQGSFRYKDLGQGTPGQLGNFYLRIVWTEGDFFSPRHMHNFDQVRVQLKGRFSFDKDGTMHPGAIGYFPEGTAYGPQTSAEDTIQLAMQIGGPSRSGYISEDERQTAVEALSKRGRFEGGKFFANDDKSGAGQDGFEAVWEYANGRRIKYPKKRLEKPLLVNPEAFEWLDVGGSPGVRAKRLWDFGASSLSCSLYHIGAGSSVSLTGPLTAFVLSGAGAVAEHRYVQYDALHLPAGEPGRIEARNESELLVMPHPVFTQPAARSTAARELEHS
ncbi:MAG: hypothetical protein JF611_05595 [Betaproteobacteria bacterium]|nr:hypothetical protein [Betaproteobacteria bacterium]